MHLLIPPLPFRSQAGGSSAGGRGPRPSPLRGRRGAQALLLALLLWGGGAWAQDAPAIRYGWGFNWRLKERATCREINEAVLPTCSRCRELPNAYKGGVDAQACYLVPKFEYVIFPTEGDCQAGLQRMKSGATP